MKKVLTLVAVAGMFSLVACGPSAEEKAAIEKAKQDSIALVEAEAKAAAAAAEAAAAEAKAVAEKATADSLAAAEEAAKKAPAKAGKSAAAPAKPKTIEQKVKEEAKAATSGRG